MSINSKMYLLADKKYTMFIILHNRTKTLIKWRMATYFFDIYLKILLTLWIGRHIFWVFLEDHQVRAGKGNVRINKNNNLCSHKIIAYYFAFIWGPKLNYDFLRMVYFPTEYLQHKLQTNHIFQTLIEILVLSF